MYNVKIIKYQDSEAQIRFYDKPIFSSKKSDISFSANDLCSDSGFSSFESSDSVSDFSVSIKEVDLERSLSNSLKRTKQSIYDITRSNSWEFFLTLTLDPVKVNRYDYSECSSKVSKFFQNIKSRKCKDLKYIIVPELHKDGAYHFHGLFSNCEGLNFVDSGFKDKKGRVIYNFLDYSLGFTTATKVMDTFKVSNYITKYLTKELVLNTPNKKRYWATRNLDKPVIEKIHYSSKDDFYSYKNSIKSISLSSKTIKVDVEDYQNTISIYEIKI